MILTPQMEKGIEYQLGQISSDISTLKEMHEDEKALREENHKKLNEINERGIRTEGAMLRMDSWKNGQTLYMHDTTSRIIKTEMDIEKLSDRITPLEKDYESRTGDTKDKSTRIKGIITNILTWIAIALIGAVLVNLGSIYQSIIERLTGK